MSTPKTSSDPVLEELRKQTALLVKISNDQAKANELAARNGRELLRILQLLERFTDGGASISQLRADPLLVAYAAMLGPILGDRVDSAVTDKGEAYIDGMLKAAVPLAERLCAELDRYRRQASPVPGLESLLQDQD
jgi:hypothetical protein